MSSNNRASLQKKIQSAVLQGSFFRVESAVIIALTLFLTSIAAVSPSIGGISPSLLAAAILVGGSLAEGAIVYSSLSDPKFTEQIVADLLKTEFRPQKLRDKELQGKVEEALDYRSRIETAIRDQKDSMLKDELIQVSTQIDQWLEHIYGLAERIDRYQGERQVLARDKERGKRRIMELERDIAKEDDNSVKQQMTTTLESLHRQLDTLDALDNTIQRAALQLEGSLTHLGTVYSQAMLVGARDIDSGSARRLRQEINEEVVELQDMLSAMDEVYKADSTAV